MNATPASSASIRPDSWISEKVRLQLEKFSSELFVPFAGKEPTFGEMSNIIRAITVKAYELGCAAADPDGPSPGSRGWPSTTSADAAGTPGRRLTRRTAADWRRIMANVLCCVVRGTTVRGQTSQDTVLFGKLSTLGGMLLAWLEQ